MTKLEQELYKRNISINMLSKILKTHYSLIYFHVKGKVNPTVNTANKIVDAINYLRPEDQVTLGDIF